ncbi:MAG: galactokinase [Clostridiaceae bacterium]|jgi:galactokinase|nr:galactokinase [Clostridiaceae bacterium]
MTTNELKRKFIEIFGDTKDCSSAETSVAKNSSRNGSGNGSKSDSKNDLRTGTESEAQCDFADISGENLRVFASPGRVNLIGEHTDYNGGYVFPAALKMNTVIIARPRKDRIIRLAATDLEDRVTASLDSLDEYKNLKWGNYQLGVADQLQKHGYEIPGCDMLFHSTIPFGAGLSSSASIEVATALTLVTLGIELFNSSGNKLPGDAQKNINLIQLAVISQKAENQYVGVNCGIMDQFASAMGKADHAILLNARDLSYKHVPLKLEDCKIVIANTNKKRGLADSKYNERRKECEDGLRYLNSAFPHARYLCDIDYDEYKAKEYLIKDEVIKRRVEHVLSENNRVLKSVEVLEKGNLDEFGKLMCESHASLRDLYEVTGIELDTLVDEALKIKGVLGSRMTGAGFGGCTVSIVKEAAIDEFIEVVGKNYYDRVGLKASFYISEIGDGASELKMEG